MIHTGDAIEVMRGMEADYDYDVDFLAELVHPGLWGDVPHQFEPGDGSDCWECFDEADRLIRQWVAA